MTYSFDTIIDRTHTLSAKYDFKAEKGMPDDVLPLWVADMDFKAPEAVTEALQKVLDHGIYGYSDSKPEYDAAVIGWFEKRFGWAPKAEWLTKTPGVVYAVNTAVRSLTREGDAVLIQRPVYYPFTRVIESNHRKVVNNPLVYEDGRYTIDFEDFEQKIIDHQVKAFILCSPHNPVGRVWTVEELTRMGEICLKHQVKVISDEIHCDFTYPGITHTVFANLRPEFSKNCITCTAPSKTFNLAGLQASNIFIEDPDLRAAFRQEITASGSGGVGIMGIVSCQAAYTHGEEWLDALKDYLKGNLDFIRDFLKEELPQVRLVEPEGTYVVWLDFTALGLSPDDLEDLMVRKAKLWLDRGNMFGEEGEGFERFNIACPRQTLKQAFTQLRDAVKTL